MGYVEKASAGRLHCCYYVVFETERGCKVITELLPTGVVAWKANPKNVEDRNSLAKVISSSDCSNPGATLGAVRSFLVGHKASKTSSMPESRCVTSAHEHQRGLWFLAS